MTTSAQRERERDRESGKETERERENFFATSKLVASHRTHTHTHTHRRNIRAYVPSISTCLLELCNTCNTIIPHGCHLLDFATATSYTPSYRVTSFILEHILINLCQLTPRQIKILFLVHNISSHLRKTGSTE